MIFGHCDCSIKFISYGEKTTTKYDVVKESTKAAYCVEIYKDATLEKLMVIASAFGFSKDCDKNRSKYIMTAGHVCSHPGDFLIMVKNKSGERFKAEIVETRDKPDLCMLKINYNQPAICLSEEEPQQGDRVVIIGHYRFFFPFMQEGFISTVSKEFIVTSNIALPGTSGSMLINEEGKLVGLLSMIRIERQLNPIILYEHGGIFCSWYAIKKFVKEINEKGSS